MRLLLVRRWPPDHGWQGTHDPGSTLDWFGLARRVHRSSGCRRRTDDRQQQVADGFDQPVFGHAVGVLGHLRHRDRGLTQAEDRGVRALEVVVEGARRIAGEPTDRIDRRAFETIAQHESDRSVFEPQARLSSPAVTQA